MAKVLSTELSGCGRFIERYYLEGEKVYRVREDVGEADLLRRNAALRSEPEALKKADWGRWALSIPQDDYEGICLLFPGIRSHDRQEQHKAYQEFMKSDLSIPYRVYPAKRGRTA